MRKFIYIFICIIISTISFGQESDVNYSGKDPESKWKYGIGFAAGALSGLGLGYRMNHDKSSFMITGAAWGELGEGLETPSKARMYSIARKEETHNYLESKC